MSDKHLTRYASERVEKFAINLIQQYLYRSFNLVVTDEDASIIVNVSDFHSFKKTMEEQCAIKHAGAFGYIRNDIQRELNFRLALCEITNVKTAKIRKIIKNYVSENDKIIKSRSRGELLNDFLKDFYKKAHLNNRKFDIFIFKMDAVFVEKKRELRLGLDDDVVYNEALRGLEKIFIKYVERAVDIVRKDIEKSPSPR